MHPQQPSYNNGKRAKSGNPLQFVVMLGWFFSRPY